MFAGYRKYQAAWYSRFYRRLPAALREGVLDPGFRNFPNLRGTALRDTARLIQKWGRSASLPPEEQFLMDCTYLDAPQRERLYAAPLRERARAWDPAAAHRRLFARTGHAHWLHQLLYVDSHQFLPALNLNYVDKMGMAASVEVRVPFLDHTLVEWAANEIPPHLKLSRGRTKHILRRAMAPLLPPEILNQRKASFGAPVGRWLEKDLHEMCGDLLGPAQIRRRGWFDPKTVAEMQKQHRSGERVWSLQLWQLLTLELWCRTFLDRKPAEAIA